MLYGNTDHVYLNTMLVLKSKLVLWYLNCLTEQIFNCEVDGYNEFHCFLKGNNKTMVYRVSEGYITGNKCTL